MLLLLEISGSTEGDTTPDTLDLEGGLLVSMDSEGTSGRSVKSMPRGKCSNFCPSINGTPPLFRTGEGFTRCGPTCMVFGVVVSP
jgi:hypothetical protein